jgi:hypothetical protein
MSDNVRAFAAALEERGLFLAKGDRGAHVVLTLDGDVFAVSRLAGKKTKEVQERFGKPDGLDDVAKTVRRIGETTGQRLRAHIAEAKRISSTAMRPLLDQRTAMKIQHQEERHKLDGGQQARFASEQRERSARVRKGLLGAWDFLTGQYAKVRQQNETEAVASLQRDRAQRQGLLQDQMRERGALQGSIEQERHRHARQLLALYHDAARFRRMREQGMAQGAGRAAGLELG